MLHLLQKALCLAQPTLPLEQEEKLREVTSKLYISKETQDFIDKLNTKNIEQISRESSLKLCMVAQGILDVYPSAPTMELDTAVAGAIVREVSKMMYQYGCDDPITYNNENLLNPRFVVQQYKD